MLIRTLALSLLFCATISATIISSTGTHAAPNGGRITAGHGELANPLEIKQHSQHLATSWESFDIASGEVVNISQPSTSALISIKVRNGSATNIDGTLNANGKVALENPAGVLFGAGSVVNVGGLLASASGTSASSGAVQANGVINAPSGEVHLQSLSNSNVVNVGGTIEAQRIIVEGANEVKLGSTARLTASKEVLVGGGFQGKGDIANSQKTIVEADVLITAPRVIIWSDVSTNFQGSIDAEGGFVEVSGKKHLASFELLKIKSAKLLLDPANIIIGTDATNNNEINDGSIAAGDGAGAFSITGTFFISAAAIQNHVGDVSLAASNAITVNENISKENGGLTLNAPTININTTSIGIRVTGKDLIINALSESINFSRSADLFAGGDLIVTSAKETTTQGTGNDIRIYASGDITVGGKINVGFAFLSITSGATGVTDQGIAGTSIHFSPNMETSLSAANMTLLTSSDSAPIHSNKNLTVTVVHALTMAGGFDVGSGDISLSFGGTVAPTPSSVMANSLTIIYTRIADGSSALTYAPWMINANRNLTLISTDTNIVLGDANNPTIELKTLTIEAPVVTVANGGNFTINADNIFLTAMVDTSGGQSGFRSTSGNLTLNARLQLNISSAHVNFSNAGLTLTAGRDIVFAKDMTITTSSLTFGGLVRAQRRPEDVPHNLTIITTGAINFQNDKASTILVADLSLSAGDTPSASNQDLTIIVSGTLSISGNYNLGTGIFAIESDRTDNFVQSVFDAFDKAGAGLFYTGTDDFSVPLWAIANNESLSLVLTKANLILPASIDIGNAELVLSTETGAIQFSADSATTIAAADITLISAGAPVVSSQALTLAATRRLTIGGNFDTGTRNITMSSGGGFPINFSTTMITLLRGGRVELTSSGGTPIPSNQNLFLLGRQANVLNGPFDLGSGVLFLQGASLQQSDFDVITNKGGAGFFYEGTDDFSIPLWAIIENSNLFILATVADIIVSDSIEIGTGDISLEAEAGAIQFSANNAIRLAAKNITLISGRAPRTSNQNLTLTATETLMLGGNIDAGTGQVSMQVKTIKTDDSNTIINAGDIAIVTLPDPDPSKAEITALGNLELNAEGDITITASRIYFSSAERQDADTTNSFDLTLSAEGEIIFDKEIDIFARNVIIGGTIRAQTIVRNQQGVEIQVLTNYDVTINAIEFIQFATDKATTILGADIKLISPQTAAASNQDFTITATQAITLGGFFNTGSGDITITSGRNRAINFSNNTITSLSGGNISLLSTGRVRPRISYQMLVIRAKENLTIQTNLDAGLETIVLMAYRGSIQFNELAPNTQPIIQALNIYLIQSENTFDATAPSEFIECGSPCTPKIAFLKESAAAFRDEIPWADTEGFSLIDPNVGIIMTNIKLASGENFVIADNLGGLATIDGNRALDLGDLPLVIEIDTTHRNRDISILYNGNNITSISAGYIKLFGRALVGSSGSGSLTLTSASDIDFGVGYNFSSAPEDFIVNAEYSFNAISSGYEHPQYQNATYIRAAEITISTKRPATSGKSNMVLQANIITIEGGGLDAGNNAIFFQNTSGGNDPQVRFVDSPTLTARVLYINQGATFIEGASAILRHTESVRFRFAITQTIYSWMFQEQKDTFIHSDPSLVVRIDIRLGDATLSLSSNGNVQFESATPNSKLTLDAREIILSQDDPFTSEPPVIFTQPEHLSLETNGAQETYPWMFQNGRHTSIIAQEITINDDIDIATKSGGDLTLVATNQIKFIPDVPISIRARNINLIAGASFADSTVINGDITIDAQLNLNLYGSFRAGNDKAISLSYGGALTHFREVVTPENQSLLVSMPNNFRLETNQLSVTSRGTSTFLVGQWVASASRTVTITALSGQVTFVNGIGNFSLCDGSDENCGNLTIAAQNIELDLGSALTIKAGTIELQAQQVNDNLLPGCAQRSCIFASGGIADFTLQALNGDITIRAGTLNVNSISSPPPSVPAPQKVFLLTTDTIVFGTDIVVNAGDIRLSNNLMAMGDLQINTTLQGAIRFDGTQTATIRGKGDILLNSNVSAAVSNQNLEVYAKGNLTIQGAFNIGSGEMTLIAGDGVSDGSSGVISFGAMALDINGNLIEQNVILTAASITLRQNGAPFASQVSATFTLPSGGQPLVDGKPLARYLGDEAQEKYDWFDVPMTLYNAGTEDIDILALIASDSIIANGEFSRFEIDADGVLDFQDQTITLITEGDIIFPDSIREIKASALTLQGENITFENRAALNIRGNFTLGGNLSSTNALTIRAHRIIIEMASNIVATSLNIITGSLGAGEATILNRGNQPLRLEASAGDITISANIDIRHNGMGDLTLLAAEEIIFTRATSIQARNIELGGVVRAVSTINGETTRQNLTLIAVGELRFAADKATTISAKSLSLTSPQAGASSQNLTLIAEGDLTLAGNIDIGNRAGAMKLVAGAGAGRGIIIFNNVTLTASAISLEQDGAPFTENQAANATFQIGESQNTLPYILYSGTRKQESVTWAQQFGLFSNQNVNLEDALKNGGVFENRDQDNSLNVVIDLTDETEAFKRNFIVDSDGKFIVPNGAVSIKADVISIRAQSIENSENSDDGITKPIILEASEAVIINADIISTADIIIRAPQIIFSGTKSVRLVGQNIVLNPPQSTADPRGKQEANNQNVELVAMGNIEIGNNINIGFGTLILDARGEIITPSRDIRIIANRIIHKSGRINNAGNLYIEAANDILLSDDVVANNHITLKAGGSIVTRDADAEIEARGEDSNLTFEQKSALRQNYALTLKASGDLRIVGPINRGTAALSLEAGGSVDFTDATLITAGSVAIEQGEPFNPAVSTIFTTLPELTYTGTQPISIVAWAARLTCSLAQSTACQ